MQKDDIVYLGHMLDMARKVSVRVEARSKADFDADEDLHFVIAHLIQTVGEAAARFSAPMREGHPEIPWKQITGIGHRIVHDYMGVDYDILWEVATRHIPPLIKRRLGAATKFASTFLGPHEKPGRGELVLRKQKQARCFLPALLSRRFFLEKRRDWTLLVKGFPPEDFQIKGSKRSCPLSHIDLVSAAIERESS